MQSNHAKLQMHQSQGNQPNLNDLTIVFCQGGKCCKTYHDINLSKSHGTEIHNDKCHDEYM